MKESSTALIISILALIISTLGLLMSVTAYNRSGRDVDKVVEDKVSEALDDVKDSTTEANENIELGAARLQAETRLIALKARVEANEDKEEIAKEIADIRSDLEEAYKDTSAETKREWEKMESGLNKLEDEVRDGAVSALDTLENLINILKEDIRES